MKKNRKQTALAKCVLATIMAMGMMGYTTVWADTPTPSPVDKEVSKDTAGQIYAAEAHNATGYFWTDLGHAQVQIGSGEQIELFTPFIYHTHNGQWNPQGFGYIPVHTGDNSEMQCKESMAQISVGEFDRIIKSLYTNDITMAKTIYGEAGQAGLKDTVIKAVRATSGQGKTVNTYELVRANDDVLAAAIVDTDTKITGNELTFADGKLTSKIIDNAGGVYTDSVDGIASQSWVNKQLEGIAGTDTVTTVAVNTNILTIEDNGEGSNHAYELGINSDQLSDFVKQHDNNTITTVQDDDNGFVEVEEAHDLNQSGNHAYTVKFNEQKLNEAIEAQDRYVNGGSIGADGSITLNVNNGRDVTLKG